MGFGHRIYKNMTRGAKLLKGAVYSFAHKLE
jgi:citrate synthase